MPLERFVAIMEQLPGVRHVKLHGLGETFLASDIMEMLRYLRQRPHTETVVVTNGNWHRDDHDEILASTRFLYFSVDGYDKRTYEQARPGGKWEVLTDNIRRFAALKHRHECYLLINFVCHAQNVHYLPRMVELCHELQVDALRINIMQSWVEEKMYPDKYASFQKLFMRNVHEFVFYYKEALRLGKQYDFDVEVIGNEWFSYNQCIWPFERAYITWEGDLVPCCMRPDPVYSVGNVLQQGIDAVWSSPQMTAIRTALRNDRPFSFCGGCPYKQNALFLREVKRLLLCDHRFGYEQDGMAQGVFRSLRHISYQGDHSFSASNLVSAAR